MASLTYALIKCLCASYLNSQVLKLGYFCPFNLASSLYKVLAEVLFEMLLWCFHQLSQEHVPRFMQCILSLSYKDRFWTFQLHIKKPACGIIKDVGMLDIVLFSSFSICTGFSLLYYYYCYF